MIRLVIFCSITFYSIQQFFNGYANAPLHETLLIISNIICGTCLLITAVYSLYIERALKKEVTHVDEDIYFNQLERRSYNASYFACTAFVIAFITLVIGFILVRDSHPMIVLLAFILWTGSLFSANFKMFEFLFPNYKIPDRKDTVIDTLDFYDDGQKHKLLITLYKLYFTTILLFILLAFALMFYSIFSGNNQIVSIIGIGIILLILFNGLSGSLKPAKLK